MAEKHFLDENILETIKFLHTDKAIRLFPRLFKRGTNYEFWGFPNIGFDGLLYENIIVIIRENEDYYSIKVYTEDPELEKNLVHLSNIENLIHDIANDISWSFYFYEDLSSIESIDMIDAILKKYENEIN